MTIFEERKFDTIGSLLLQLDDQIPEKEKHTEAISSFHCFVKVHTLTLNLQIIVLYWYAETDRQFSELTGLDDNLNVQ